MNKANFECNLKGITCTWTSKPFLNAYSAEVYKAVSNLDPQSSVGKSELFKGILDGTADSGRVAYLTSYDMTPSATQSERDMIAIRLQQKVDKKVVNKKCRKCGHKGAEFIEYQSRCADEGSSQSYRCINCQYVWH